jgi:hypothetical protein
MHKTTIDVNIKGLNRLFQMRGEKTWRDHPADDLHHTAPFLQSIMLATRPFLFSFLERRFESINTKTVIPTPVKCLLHICMESAKKAIYILGALQDQSLLGRQTTDYHSNRLIHGVILISFLNP